MDRITRSTDRLEQFARSILDYSQSSDLASKQEISLCDVLRDAIQQYFPELEGSIRIRNSGPCRILGDPIRMERAFTNLIRNSLEAGSTEVTVSFEADDEEVKVVLVDNGAGCDAENLSRLGTPFFTTMKSKGGTGLGLAMTASIVQDHGGTVKFSESVNKPFFPCSHYVLSHIQSCLKAVFIS